MTAWSTPAAGATRSSCARGSRSRSAAPTATGRSTARSRSTSCRGSCPVDEWRTIKRGLAQRIRALNHFVDDVYHGREIVHDGVVPWPLVVSRKEFARAAHGIRPPGGVYCHVSGCDLVRDADGSWKVLEDNVRTPSGISYMLENRRAMTRLLPGLFSSYRVRPVDHYPMLLLNALREVAPAGDGEPTVVVWTPGPLNSAYFEHAFLARQMGVELVEASDLVVRDELCFIRTTNGLERVHAIYRRLDDTFIDPLEFRPDSLLGVPGLMRAYRAGTVAIVNAVGTGVADDKAVYHYVPEMIRYYLGEEPILDNVRTYMLDDPEQREHVLGRLSELVVKPTSESGGKGVFIGPSATDEQVERQRRLIEASPARWIAQELVRLSTCPTAMEDGRLAPRHVDLRPFAVFGDDIHIVPGGLTRVALVEGSMIVNSSQGGGSKDTWVLEEEAPPGRGRGRPRPRLVAAAAARPAPARRLVVPAAGPAAVEPTPCWPGSPTSCTGSAAHSHAPSTPRACSTGCSTRTCRGGAADGGGVRLTWDSMLVIMGLELGASSTDRDEVVRRLTLDRGNPASVVSCVAQAREGARTVRDVFSGEMWEAINTMQLGLASDASDAFRTGPYSVYAYIRERCGQFWGVTDRTMLRDEAYAFLLAGARIEAADMTLRMLRVALPAAESPQREDAEALALLQAVGGLQAYRRQVPLPPNALPVMRFLLYAREYPGSVAASVDTLLDALTSVDERARTAAPVLRLRRLTADLEFRSREGDGERDVGATLATVQLELAQRGPGHRRPLLRAQRRAAAARSLTRPACASPSTT